MFAHPGIDPFPVHIATAWDEDEAPTAFDPRPHYNVTTAFMAAHPELEANRVLPSPMARVFAGDDPASPAWTVALRFEDEAALMGSALAAYDTTP